MRGDDLSGLIQAKNSELEESWLPAQIRGSAPENLKYHTWTFELCFQHSRTGEVGLSCWGLIDRFRFWGLWSVKMLTEGRRLLNIQPF